MKNAEDSSELEHRAPPVKKKVVTLQQDPIKIYDAKQSEVSYKLLTQYEKEKVLSEILFQSALNNIKNHQTVIKYNNFT